MKITAQDILTYTKITLSGEFDIDTEHAEFLDLVDTICASKRSILIDLKNVPYMCSSDISVIVQTRRKAEANKCKIAVCNCQSAVDRVFEMTNVKTIMNFFDDETSAQDFLCESGQ